jgi:hypothetical protein
MYRRVRELSAARGVERGEGKEIAIETIGLGLGARVRVLGPPASALESCSLPVRRALHTMFLVLGF